MKFAIKQLIRYREAQVFLHQFADEFLVVCPQCRKCATVTRHKNPESGTLVWSKA